MQRTDIEIARSIVEMVVGVDIHKSTRKREVVDGRMIYASLLREAGYILTFIGKTIKKDHTTIIHYVESAKDLIETSPQFRGIYMKCKKLFDEEIGNGDVVYADEGRTEIERLRMQLLFMKNQVNEILEERDRMQEILEMNDKHRFVKLFSYIDKETPLGKEYIVERGIRKLIDDLL